MLVSCTEVRNSSHLQWLLGSWQRLFPAVTPENVYFRRLANGTEDIKSVLASEPRPTIRKNKTYSVVISQPLAHGCSWKDKKKKVANWSLYLSGFGHGMPSPTHWIYFLKLFLPLSAQQLNPRDQPVSAKTNVDYSFAPETLLHSAYCSDETDIWMLGYMASQANCCLHSFSNLF